MVGVQSVDQSAGTVEMTVISMAAASSVPLRYNNLPGPCTVAGSAAR